MLCLPLSAISSQCWNLLEVLKYQWHEGRPSQIPVKQVVVGSSHWYLFSPNCHSLVIGTLKFGLIQVKSHAFPGIPDTAKPSSHCRQSDFRFSSNCTPHIQAFACALPEAHDSGWTRLNPFQSPGLRSDVTSSRKPFLNAPISRASAGLPADPSREHSARLQAVPLLRTPPPASKGRGCLIPQHSLGASGARRAPGGQAACTQTLVERMGRKCVYISPGQPRTRVEAELQLHPWHGAARMSHRTYTYN